MYVEKDAWTFGRSTPSGKLNIQKRKFALRIPFKRVPTTLRGKHTLRAHFAFTGFPLAY